MERVLETFPAVKLGGPIDSIWRFMTMLKGTLVVLLLDYHNAMFFFTGFLNQESLLLVNPTDWASTAPPLFLIVLLRMNHNLMYQLQV